MLAWLLDRDLHKHNSDEEIVRKEILAAGILHSITSISLSMSTEWNLRTRFQSKPPQRSEDGNFRLKAHFNNIM